MKIHVSVYNHGPASRETLRDMLEPIIGALRALGHAVTGPDSGVRGDSVNLLAECFTHEQAVSLTSSPLRYAILATEWFDGQRLTSGWQPPERSAAFLMVAPKAQFIWSVVDQLAYQSFGVPYRHTPLAYEPSCYKRNETPPTHDLCVYGPVTDDRAAIRADLDRWGVDYVWVPWGARKEARDTIIGSCRYVLALPATGTAGEPSPSRRAASLYADRPLLAVEDIPHIRVLRDRWEMARVEQLLEFESGPQMRQVLREAT